MVWRWTHSPSLCACLFYVFYNVGYKEIINGACCQRRKYHHGHVTMYYDVPCMKLRAQINGMSSPAWLADPMFSWLHSSHQSFEELSTHLTQNTSHEACEASMKQAAPLHICLLFLHEDGFCCVQILENSPSASLLQFKHQSLSIQWQTIWADRQTAKNLDSCYSGSRDRLLSFLHPLEAIENSTICAGNSNHKKWHEHGRI